MKVLTPLIVLLALSSLSYANDQNKSLDSYISESKKQQFNYDYEKNEAEGAKLRDSWIAPLNLSYTYSKSEVNDEETSSESTSIKLNQTVFQSGGIYFGIKYANASKDYADLNVDVLKRRMVKDAISTLMQIKQTDFRIQKQELQIKNSEINLEQKKEQYLSGQLDSGFLDNAIIERNIVIQTLYDIESSKEKLISIFQAISDLDYSTVLTPYLDNLNKDEFIKHNIVLKLNESEIEKSRYFKNVTISKYLPKINVQAGYNIDKTNNINFGGDIVQKVSSVDYIRYGFVASMPLDINVFNDIESSRIDYLKSRVAVEDKKRELIAIYDQVAQNLDNLEKKKVLSLENKEIYQRLLDETKELYSAGQKTEYDVALLQNSVDISKTDYKIFEIDKQLELLTLYEMYKKDN